MVNVPPVKAGSLRQHGQANLDVGLSLTIGSPITRRSQANIMTLSKDVQPPVCVESYTGDGSDAAQQQERGNE